MNLELIEKELHVNLEDYTNALGIIKPNTNIIDIIDVVMQTIEYINKGNVVEDIVEDTKQDIIAKDNLVIVNITNTKQKTVLDNNEKYYKDLGENVTQKTYSYKNNYKKEEIKKFGSAATSTENMENNWEPIIKSIDTYNDKIKKIRDISTIVNNKDQNIPDIIVKSSEEIGKVLEEKNKKLWDENHDAHKISSHLEAGLPSIVNDQLSFLADVVDKNDFGIVIKNVSELSDKIKDADYEKIIEKIKRNRSEFTLDKKIDKLISFINQINTTKKC